MQNRRPAAPHVLHRRLIDVLKSCRVDPCPEHDPGATGQGVSAWLGGPHVKLIWPRISQTPIPNFATRGYTLCALCLPA